MGSIKNMSPENTVSALKMLVFWKMQKSFSNWGFVPC